MLSANWTFCCTGNEAFIKVIMLVVCSSFGLVGTLTSWASKSNDARWNKTALRPGDRLRLLSKFRI
jgi:hypothetical protein